MKVIIVVIGLIALACANPWRGQQVPRHYDTGEMQEDRVKFFLWQDKNGSLYYEDLEQEASIRATAGDVTLYMFTRNNKNNAEIIKATDFQGLVGSKNFNKGKKNVFITHGWTNSFQSPVNTMLKAAILEKHDVNVFVVDWAKIADKNYVSSKKAVPDIGEAVGDFIIQMIDHYKVKSGDFHLIGHSLGAHVSGCAGARVKSKGNVAYIIGLDPAMPLYTLGNTDNRLDPTDGDYVQIIHTNGGLLGFSSSIGHSDYYPNGGSRQPGCGLDVAGTCAHSRSYEYLAESILHGGFASHSCASLKDYTKGKCNDNHQSYVGTYSIDKTADGDYYLTTNDQPLFSLV